MICAKCSVSYTRLEAGKKSYLPSKVDIDFSYFIVVKINHAWYVKVRKKITFETNIPRFKAQFILSRSRQIWQLLKLLMSPQGFLEVL